MTILQQNLKFPTEQQAIPKMEERLKGKATPTQFYTPEGDSKNKDKKKRLDPLTLAYKGTGELVKFGPEGRPRRHNCEVVCRNSLYPDYKIA